MLSHLLAFVAPAAAFLVVPNMAPASHPDETEGAFKALPIDDISPFALPSTVQSQTVSVPCANCAGGLEASVQFDIKVHDHNKLLINGFEVYPAEEPLNEGAFTANMWSEDSPVREEELSWVIWWQVSEVDKSQGMHVLDFHVNVDSVGRAAVDDVNLGMSLIIGPHGEILIADVQTPPAPPRRDEPVCKGWWCRFEQALDNMFKGRPGCHRHHGQKPATVPRPGMSHEDEEKEGPHGHHHHHHHMGKMMKNVAAHVFLPVVMGITAGVGAAALVMFLCSIVTFVARKIAGREAQYSWTLVPAKTVLVEDVSGDDEKSGLITGQAPPPAYEERSEKE